MEWMDLIKAVVLVAGVSSFLVLLLLALDYCLLISLSIARTKSVVKASALS